MTALMAVIVLLAGGCVREPEQTEKVRIGDQLPDFEVTLSDGRTVSTRTLAGKCGAIIFFNTSCQDCRREFPEMQRQYEACAPLGAEVICISREESAESVAAYWGAAGLTIPYAACEDRRIYSLFAISGIPRVYVFDGGGRVVAQEMSALRSLAAGHAAEPRTEPRTPRDFK